MPSSEAAAALQASLGRIYGPAIRVCYYDISVPQIRAEHADTIAALRADELPFPVVLLDGQVLYAGAINPLRIVAAVAQEYERRASRLP
jgi:disulfide oxidoreductase YuzD